MKARVFQLIDLDRTLFNTSKFTKLITNGVDKLTPGLGAELDQHFEAAYKQGETFFVLRHLREQYGDDWFEALVADIIDTHGAEAFLLPGFKERLAFAEAYSAAHPGWGILTYGDLQDQTIKLRIAGLDTAPVLLTDTPDKGAIIASWQLEDGTYHLPGAFGDQIVDSVTFEDDKLRAFYDMPKNATGVWITQDPQAKERITEAGFTNVVPAQDLFASIESIKNI